MLKLAQYYFKGRNKVNALDLMIFLEEMNEKELTNDFIIIQNDKYYLVSGVSKQEIPEVCNLENIISKVRLTTKENDE